jgi:hypothetical protein
MYRINFINTPVFLKTFVPQNYISSNKYGVVFQACHNLNRDCHEISCENNKIPQCKYVIKIMHTQTKTHKAGRFEIIDTYNPDIINEIRLAGELGKNNVGLKVERFFSCEGEVNVDGVWEQAELFFLVMEKMDMTLKTYKETCPTAYAKNVNKINNEINSLLTFMNNRYSNNNTDNNTHKFHDTDFMVNVENCEITKIRIINAPAIVATKNKNSSRKPIKNSFKPKQLEPPKPPSSRTDIGYFSQYMKSHNLNNDIDEKLTITPNNRTVHKTIKIKEPKQSIIGRFVVQNDEE